jgi:hypothetical protein
MESLDTCWQLVPHARTARDAAVWDLGSYVLLAYPGWPSVAGCEGRDRTDMHSSVSPACRLCVANSRAELPSAACMFGAPHVCTVFGRLLLYWSTPSIVESLKTTAVATRHHCCSSLLWVLLPSWWLLSLCESQPPGCNLKPQLLQSGHASGRMWPAFAES